MERRLRDGSLRKDVSVNSVIDGQSTVLNWKEEEGSSDRLIRWNWKFESWPSQKCGVHCKNQKLCFLVAVKSPAHCPCILVSASLAKRCYMETVISPNEIKSVKWKKHKKLERHGGWKKEPEILWGLRAGVFDPQIRRVDLTNFSETDKHSH